MKDSLNVISAVITIIAFPVTVAQVLPAFGLFSETLQSWSFQLNFGSIGILVYIICTFLFGYCFASMVNFFTNDNKILILVAHPSIGFVSGLQTVAFIEILFSRFNDENEFAISSYVLILLIAASLALENVLIYKRIRENPSISREVEGFCINYTAKISEKYGRVRKENRKFVILFKDEAKIIFVNSAFFMFACASYLTESTLYGYSIFSVVAFSLISLATSALISMVLVWLIDG